MTKKLVDYFLIAFFAALVFGFVLLSFPCFTGSFIGHLLGIAGAILMCLALVYPFRKRVLGKRGRSNSLDRHILFGLSGPTLVVLHAGHEMASPIDTLVFSAMLLVVFSGIVGRFLFKKINRSLKDQKKDVAALHTLLKKRKSEVTSSELARYLGETPLEEADEPACTRCEGLREVAIALAEQEYALEFYDRTKKLFSRWSRVHIYLTFLLFGLIVLHVVTSLYYGLWWLR